jgi:outer membrane protein TolC
MITSSRLALMAALALPVVLRAQTAEVPVVTLPEARRLSWTVDPDAVRARGDVGTSAWERRAALADLIVPELTAGASYLTFSDPFFNFGTGDVSPTATSATLEARYTLLGGGKFAEVKRSRAALASAEASETLARFRTSLETDAAYYSVLEDNELSRVARNTLRRATEQLAISRARVEAGDAIATDSLQLLLQVNDARLAVLRRDSALVVSRLELGRRIGRAGPADAAPFAGEPPAALPLDLSQLTTELRANGPEILAARADEQRAGATLATFRSLYVPELSVSATLGAYDSELFPSALKRNQLAVQVSWPIWNGGRREVAVARARANRDLARAERDEQERGSEERMAQAHNGYTTARAAFDLATIGVTVSAENYRVQSARYREGATTILDLLEAQVRLSEAEAELVQARYSARLALARIEALLGRRLFAEDR